MPAGWLRAASMGFTGSIGAIIAWGHRSGVGNVLICRAPDTLGHLDISIVTHYDACMRTTLTLDDDIADSLREQARLLDMPFKQVVNETLRRGLSPGVREERAPYRVVPIHSGFAPGVDPLKLNQLNDELDVEDFLEESAR